MRTTAKTCIALIAIVAIVTGCNYTSIDEVLPDSSAGAAVTMLRFSEGALCANTRTVDENTITFVQYFLFDSGEELVCSGTTDTATAALRQLSPGTYRLLATANYLCPVENPTMENLESLMLDCGDISEMEYMPMSFSGDITIRPQDGTVNVELVRMLAKVDYSLSVASGFGEFETVWIRLCNISTEVKWFADGELTKLSDGSYYDGEIEYITLREQNTTIGSFYLPENRRGVVPGIDDQRKKNLENAPDGSTYIHIRGRNYNSGEVFDYFVFLGENPTDDFNVCRNTNYNYAITITGSNPEDLRVACYNVSVLTEYEGELKYQQADLDFRQTVEVRCSPFVYELDLTIVCVQGKWEYMTARGIPFTDGVCELGRINDPDDSHTGFATRIFYSPPLFDANNRDVILDYIITDQYGFQTVIRKSYMCANMLKVFRVWNGGRDRGTVTYGNNDWLTHTTDGSKQYTTVYSYGSTTTVIAGPPTGSSFMGWFSDPTLTQLYYEWAYLIWTPDIAVQEVYPNSKEDYSVVYHPNGVQGKQNTYPVWPGGMHTVRTQSTVSPKTEYKFIEWNTLPDGTGESYLPDEVIYPVGKLNLYAQWDRSTMYEITYYANNGSDASFTGQKTGMIGGYAEFEIESDENLGWDYFEHTFQNWNTREDGRGTNYYVGQKVNVSKNMELYAVWYSHYIYVTYDPNGSTGGTVDKIPKDAFSKKLLTQETAKIDNRPGFAFRGWYFSPNPEIPGPYYNPGQSFSLGGTYLTVYAIWYPSQYTVTYSANGGTGSYVVDYVSGQDHKIMTPEAVGISREGYDFVGWSTYSGEGAAPTHTIGQWVRMTKNLKLYAQWKLKE